MTEIDRLGSYAGWLEQLCKKISEVRPKKIGVVLLDCEKQKAEDRDMSIYMGDTPACEKLRMAAMMQMDASTEVALEAALYVIDKLNEESEDDEDGEI